MKSGGASRTAVFVCQGRAVADGRLAVGQFSDPVAASLLSDDELVAVSRARAGVTAASGAERFTTAALAACAEVVVPRTVLIDVAIGEALTRRAGCQVVLLGAGLDSRAWRLRALDGVPVFSVDHPASQADLRRRAEGLLPTVCDLRYAAIDLTSQPLGPPLRSAGHDPDRPSIWVWEGVIPYLSRDSVRDTLDAVTSLSAPGSTLIAQYQARWLLAALGRRAAGAIARLSGVDSPTADEPWRSTWSASEVADMLAGRGWSVDSDVSLLEHARRIGSGSDHSRSLGAGRVAVAGR